MKPINETPISSDAAYERETVINFCDAEKKASYYTRNRSRMQELRNLAAEYPDDVIFNMILGFGQYQYLGVPQDGYSYDQLKNKYDERKATAANTQTVYTQPPQDYQPNQNVSYQNPNTQYQQPQQPVYPQQSYQQAPQQPTYPQQAPVQPQDSNGMSQPKPPAQSGQ